MSWISRRSSIQCDALHASRHEWDLDRTEPSATGSFLANDLRSGKINIEAPTFRVANGKLGLLMGSCRIEKS